MYMDDVQLIGSDRGTLTETKDYIKQYFIIKDMGKLKYFLGQKLCISAFLNKVCIRSLERDCLLRSSLLVLYSHMWTFGVKIVQYMRMLAA